MSDNYQFLDAYASVQTAASSVIGGAHRPIIIIGSVLTSFPATLTGNVSVSGAVDTSFGNSSIIAYQPAGSILATSNSSVQLLGGSALIGSVVARLYDAAGSPLTTTSNYLNVNTAQGTSGSFASSVFQANPSSLLTGASIFGQLPGGTAVLGSVAALQGTNPWNVAIVSGSVATATTNSSVQLLNSANVIGSVATLQGTNPWITTFSNSSIFATQQGTHIASVIQSNPSSLLTGASIFGMVPAGTQVIGSVATLQGTNPWNVAIVSGSVATATTNSSVMLLNGAGIIGSVTALQGTSPWLISSVYGNISGSVASQQIGTRTTSVVGSIPSSLLTGNYGFRNDTVASFLGGDKSWNQLATDSAGRILTKAFTPEDGTVVSYASSVTSTSVTLIQGSTIGKRVYVTDFWLSNTGATTTLVTLQDGSTSILGQFIAPTGGGMSSPGLAVPLKTAPAQDLAWKSNSASSIVYLTIKGYVAP